MPRSIRVDGVLVKAESTYATDAVPVAGTDGFRIAERITSKLQVGYAFPNLRGDVANGGLRHAAPAPPGGRMVRFTLPWDARGAGAAYADGGSPVRPECDPALLACGYQRTHSGGAGSEQIAYDPIDTGHGSCTVYAYGDGKVFRIVGCRGNLRIPINAGQIGIWYFDMEGILLTDPADASLPSITYDAVVPSPQQGITFTLGGFTPDLISAEFASGGQIELLEDATATNAIDQFAIAEYLSTLKMQVYAPTIAERNIWADMDAATGLTLAIAGAGAQYNRWKLDIASGVHVNEVTPVEVKRFNAYDVACTTSAAETITFD